MKTWDEYFDGEEHELVAGRDFHIPTKIWDVATLSWRPLTTEELRSHAVADGWSLTAIRLRYLAAALGGQGFPVQKGRRYLFTYVPPGGAHDHQPYS